MNDKPRTIRALLAATTPWLAARGIEGARTDAEILIAHALGLRRLDLYLDLDRPLGDDELARARALVARRGKREPVAYLVGTRELWGLAFEVTPDVLVPRPETEHLIEVALARLLVDVEGTIVDACTGSGCVAVALLHERPGLSAVATDLSSAACAVAVRNAERHGVAARLDVRQGDLLAPCAELRNVLAVVANPPYVRDDEKPALAPELAFEPALALFGEGHDALGHHRRLLDEAPPLVRAGGFLACEIGASQGEQVCALPHEGFTAAVVSSDLAGHPRVACWQRT
ncbi:MAG: protein-(glutamine-N5) methyltransferase, release factor-specific [Deltaproteobacteria bacterium RBG_16_71_12]|nr:MAG: protein-(glutamine-N5) methyltransferase, release factor-specific [Deltaproteobacteria bacterium RBG_16_71_12]